MKTHAVKEILLDCLLCVEVEPEPKAITDNYFHYGNIICSLAALESEYAPIAIGDTVYQGRECLFRTDAIRHSWKSPETMPIERAEKTYKVVGIEVELREDLKTEMVNVMKPEYPPMLAKHIHLEKKWCWNYKLEEIKNDANVNKKT